MDPPWKRIQARARVVVALHPWPQIPMGPCPDIVCFLAYLIDRRGRA